MKYIELQEAFEREINLFHDGLNKPDSFTTEWWLNRGLEKFYKTRYSGINFKQKGFEQDQKRIDDLRTLVVYKLFQDSEINVNNNEYSITLPNDYIVLLGNTTGILPADGLVNKCWEKDDLDQYIIKFTEPLECTVDTVDREKENSLSEYRLQYCYARPLRLIQNNEIHLMTDGKYKIASYGLTYLRKPQYIDIHTDPIADYTDMPEHTHSEIVKLAAQMYLENTKDPRYNSISNEVKEME